MKVPEMTLDELRELLLEAAGEPEGVEPARNIYDVTFQDMGYDSLALLETSSRIERKYGIVLGDSTVVEAETPRVLLNAINKVLSASEAAA